MSARRERAKAHRAQHSKQEAVAVVKPVGEHPVAKKMGDVLWVLYQPLSGWVCI